MVGSTRRWLATRGRGNWPPIGGDGGGGVGGAGSWAEVTVIYDCLDNGVQSPAKGRAAEKVEGHLEGWEILECMLACIPFSPAGFIHYFI